MKDEWYVITIHWDDEHRSPPIGPIVGQTPANREATRIRKLLRRAGYTVRQRMVEVELLQTTEWIRGVLSERIEVADSSRS